MDNRPPLTDDVATRLRALAANAVAEHENVERVSKDSNARMGDVNVATLHRTKAVIKMQSAISPQTILTMLDRISEADAKCAVLVEARDLWEKRHELSHIGFNKQVARAEAAEARVAALEAAAIPVSREATYIHSDRDYIVSADNMRRLDAALAVRTTTPQGESK